VVRCADLCDFLVFLTDDGSHPAAAAVAARARVRVDIQTAFRSREMKPCPRRWLARNPSATPSFASAYCSTSPRCSSTWHHSPGWWSSTSPRIQYSDPDQDLQDLQVLLLRSGTKYVSPGGKRRPWPGVQKRAPSLGCERVTAPRAVLVARLHVYPKVERLAPTRSPNFINTFCAVKAVNPWIEMKDGEANDFIN
jgi:hypothetical protein